MKGKRKTFYLKHKLDLFFDQNFPLEIVNRFKNSSLSKRVRIKSVVDLNLQDRDDLSHFDYCKKMGFTIVTLDDDFMNDKKFPFGGIPGIIRIVAAKNNLSDIQFLLRIIVDFLTSIPLPKIFIGDSKFQVSLTSCVMRAKDYKSGEVKTMEIIPDKTTDLDVMRFFNYLR